MISITGHLAMSDVDRWSSRGRHVPDFSALGRRFDRDVTARRYEQDHRDQVTPHPDLRCFPDRPAPRARRNDVWRRA